MIARGIAVLTALMFATLTPTVATLRAQAQQPDQPQSALSKQDLARAKFKDLTERMQKMMTVLQKSEPQDSQLLAVGLQFVQEKKLHQRLEHSGSLLQQERWDDAVAVMGEIKKDLSTLYELLQNRNVDLRKLLEQIQKMQAFRDRVDQLAKEQGEEKDASARTEDLQKHLAEIEAQKQRAEKLLEQQKLLREQTNELGVQAAAEASKPLAEKEGDLQQDTEKLAKELEALEQKDEQLKNEANKPSSSAKPGEPSDSKPSEAKSGGGKCSGSAGKASQAMGQAQKQLGDNKPEPSLKDQEHAIEQLKKTVEELEAMAEEARRELLKLPFDQQAKQQEQTQHATDTLSKDMEKAEEAGENAEPQPTPGKKRVQQAVPKQRAAAGQLKEPDRKSVV